MKKIIFLVLATVLTFSSFSFVLAEETTITSQDLNVSEPTVLPNNFFYFLKEFGREVQLLVTLDPVKKAEAKLKIASEKLIEAEKLSNNKEAFNNALTNYTNSLDSLKNYVSTLKPDSESSDLLLKKIAVQTFNQQKILNQIAEKQTDSAQKILEAKERALNSLTNTSLELGSNEKIKEALEEATETTKSGTTNVIEVLKRVESIVPEQAKQSIIEAQNRIIEKRLANTNISEEDKNKLNAYLEELKTKTEYKNIISENYIQNLINNNQEIFNNLGNISEEDKAKIVEYGKSVLKDGNANYEEILDGLSSLSISDEAKKIVDQIQSKIVNSNQTSNSNNNAPIIGMANPASKFCVDQGYKLEMRTDETGGQYGVCIFTNGKECEEWKFFRKECGKEYIKNTTTVE